MKKIIFVLSALLIAAQGAAYAEITKTSISDDGELSVIGKTTEPKGTDVSVLVVRPGKDYTKIVSDEKDGEKAADSLEAIGQIKVGENSIYEYTYKMHADAVSGEYAVYARTYGTDITDKTTFIYSNKKRLIEAYEKIKNGEAVWGVLNEYAGDIDYSLSEKFKNFSDKQKEYIADGISKSTLTDANDLKTEFSDYCTIAINCADLKAPEKETAKNMIESLWKKIGIEESTYSDYTQLSSSKQEWVIADVISNSKTGMLPKDVAEQFRKSVNEAKNKKNTGGTSGGGSSSSGFSAGTAANTTVEPQKTAGKFTDLESVSWAEEAINTLAKYDVINGKSENIFAPNDYIKREEFAQLIVKSFNIPSGTQKLKFEDVSKDAWYYDSLKKAFSNGIINGMSETKFGTGVQDIVSEESSKVSIMAENRGTADENADFMLALYTADGRLCSVKKATGIVGAGKINIISIEIENTGDYSYGKLMVWRNGELTPLTEAFSL